VLEKANGRDKRGSTSRPSIFVVTVLTPATTETEDSPTVSSCPTIYIATRVPCKALFIEEYQAMNFLSFSVSPWWWAQKKGPTRRQKQGNYFKPERKIFTMSQAKLPALSRSRLLTPLPVFRFPSGSRLQSLPVPAVRFQNNARAASLGYRARLLSRAPRFELPGSR
jgi:hypothetical protein